MTLAQALFWIVLAGVGQGAFPLPMKYTRRWAWEHLWLWYSAIALFVIPVLLAVVTVPDLPAVLRAVPAAALFRTIVFGLTWGAGSVLFGLGIDALGMTLGFPIMTGLTTALGALIPMAILTPDLLFRRSGLFTIGGNAVTILGVIASAVAGDWRQRQLGHAQTASILGPSRKFSAALAICVLSGVLSAMFNFGFAFGTPITEAAAAHGATVDNATNALWLVILPAGGLVNIGYCIYLSARNRSHALFFRGSGRDWSSASAMALMWTGSVVLYGWGANGMGKFGASIGWSLWNSILLATTVLCGLATGEWTGVHGKPLRLLWLSIAILAVGTLLLGAGA